MSDEGSPRGLFIVFEGGEGTGKSTQSRLLVERLRAAGRSVTPVREPGGTMVGDRIRWLLLDPSHTGMDPRAELLLYEASRAQLCATVIAPRLEAGGHVVCDRFTDSTLAYQGCGRGLDCEEIATLNRWATGGLVPDLVLLLDLDPATGLARATGEGADRLEAEEFGFHERVRKGFLDLAAASGHVVIDASLPVEDTAAQVWDAVVAVDPTLSGSPAPG
jgi:dTMP kinase